MGTSHRFGGPRTECKLEALHDYLVQYQLIFKRNPRARTVYVDAFAGTGERDGAEREEGPGLFGHDEEIRGYQEGSVRKALSIDNKFDQYIFVENKPTHAAALKKLIASEFSSLSDRCTIEQEDANTWLQGWCRTQHWSRQRAVVFLDPYGMNVDWQTMEAIALPWPRNVWMGVSVEDGRVLHRIANLQGVPAAVRFLSLEPLIGPLDKLLLGGIHWVIVGGESGPKARPLRKEWVTSIFKQCRTARVPFFFKQWGGVRKDLTGRALDGHVYDEMPGALQPA
jgi:three-Cys-motif partner protein